MTSDLDAFAAPLCAAIVERDAAHAAWLAATWPPTPGNITLPIEAADANRGRAAWDAACRRVSELEDVADNEGRQAVFYASEISEEVLEDLLFIANEQTGADAG